jgi:divalent metal cation (Fe/Co/Zn/Cd) transporter
MDKIKAGYIEGTVSIVINSALFVVKMWAGIVTGSIALAADAWHTLSDSLSSVVVVIAAKLSSKKADKEHPFGHGRWEQIASLFIAVILGIIAYDFLRKSIKTGNTSVKADGWHHRSDSLSSIVVLIGILFARQFWWIDSVLGIIIAIMLFYATFSILREAITKLLGEEPSQDLISKITYEVINTYGNDLKIHHFHIHNYVLHKELTLHIKLNGNLTIEKGHEVATGMENLTW